MHSTTLCRAHEDRTRGASRVEDSQEVRDLSFKIGRGNVSTGDTEATPVMDNHAGVPGWFEEERSPVGLIPDQVYIALVQIQADHDVH